MNKTINKFLLTGGIFMPVLHLKQQEIVKEFKNLEKQVI